METRQHRKYKMNRTFRKSIERSYPKLKYYYSEVYQQLGDDGFIRKEDMIRVKALAAAEIDYPALPMCVYKDRVRQVFRALVDKGFSRQDIKVEQYVKIVAFNGKKRVDVGLWQLQHESPEEFEAALERINSLKDVNSINEPSPKEMLDEAMGKSSPYDGLTKKEVLEMIGRETGGSK